MTRFFSKISGTPATGDVDSHSGTGGGRPNKAGPGSTHDGDVGPADFSELRSDAPDVTSCVAAAHPSVSHAARGGTGVTADAGPATSLRYTSAAASGGAGLSFQMTRTPRLPRGVTFAFCVPCGRRGAAHRDGVCTNSERHP